MSGGIKGFINGHYRYNPKISPERIRSLRASARYYTPYIAAVVCGGATWETSEWEGGRPLGLMIRMRARLFRLARQMRVRLISAERTNRLR